MASLTVHNVPEASKRVQIVTIGNVPDTLKPARASQLIGSEQRMRATILLVMAGILCNLTLMTCAENLLKATLRLSSKNIFDMSLIAMIFSLPSSMISAFSPSILPISSLYLIGFPSHHFFNSSSMSPYVTIISAAFSIIMASFCQWFCFWPVLVAPLNNSPVLIWYLSSFFCASDPGLHYRLFWKVYHCLLDLLFPSCQRLPFAWVWPSFWSLHPCDRYAVFFLRFTRFRTGWCVLRLPPPIISMSPTILFPSSAKAWIFGATGCTPGREGGDELLLRCT
uniref:Uncharacterized protein n=1 Tax=Glossina brevipalpis TaxID=37001 RepID=A0A1A9X2S2_9MUSC